MLYHLVLNTDLVSYDEAAQIIANAILKRLLLARIFRVRGGRVGRCSDPPGLE